jgi:hypothetical protein
MAALLAELAKEDKNSLGLSLDEELVIVKIKVTDSSLSIVYFQNIHLRLLHEVENLISALQLVNFE